MAMDNDVFRLPIDLLNKAVRSGNSLCWKVKDIPDVIRAASELDFANMGGVLQFTTEHEACEAYWVRVFPERAFEKSCGWDDFVCRSASETLYGLFNLFMEYDFMHELGRGFQAQIDAFAAQGNDPRDAVRFTWSVRSLASFEAIYGPFASRRTS